MHRWIPIAIAILVAGCADPAETTEPERETIIDADRPDTTYGKVETGPAVGPDLNATTADAPKWIPGEWWRIVFHDYLDADEIEVLRVVADVDDEGYIVGMPHEGWLKEAIAFHSPGFGDINFDLSYDTHNVVFQTVRFPIMLGDTWETEFATAPYAAEVTAADEHTATIEMTPISRPQPTDPLFALLGSDGGGKMILEYDARQHAIVKMTTDFGWWEVTEHGYDYEGWVTIPRGEHTAVDYGTFLPASDSHDVRERTVEVSDEFNRITMMHLAGTVSDAPGYFETRSVTPGGEEWITELQGTGFKIEFFEARDPGGAWTVQDTVGGAGFTYHMGIAYFQYDIRLPDGARRADHSHEVIR